MKKSKVPFDRALFHELIEKENWHYLWCLIDDSRSVNITEEDLRLAFSIMPKKYVLRNGNNWNNRFSVDFLREFKDRFKWSIFEYTRPAQKNSKVFDEFFDEDPLDNRYLISMDSGRRTTDVLKWKHDLRYVMKYSCTFDYARIFNWWGCREKFNLPDEEIKYLKEHTKLNGWGNHFEE